MFFNFAKINNLKCRTCNSECKERQYSITNGVSSVGVFNKTTIKEAILLLVPELVDKITDRDIVCNYCRRILCIIAKFRRKCLEVQDDLVDIGRANDLKDLNNVVSPKREVETDEEMFNNNLLLTNLTKSDLTFDVKDHNTVVSLHSNPMVLNSIMSQFVLNGIQIYQQTLHSQLDDKPKRILLLASTQNDCKTCKLCEKVFIGEKSLYRHQKKAHKIKKYRGNNKKVAWTCIICKESMETQEEFQEHIKAHPQFVCEHCGKGFGRLVNLRIHYRTHNTPDSFLCGVCGRGFKTSTTLKAHAFTHEKRIYGCHLCNRKFTKISVLKNHLLLHDEGNSEKRKVCEICGKKFATLGSLMKHYRVIHQDKSKARGELGGETFPRPDFLRTHMLQHLEPTNRQRMKRSKNSPPDFWPCNFCNKTFKTQSTLIDHRRVHDIVHRYKCKFCSFTFKQSANRRRHEKCHLRDPQFNLKCPVCWRRFLSMEEKEEHLLSHPKPFKCGLCERAFPRQYLLGQHVSEYHGEEIERKKWKCDETGVEKHSLNSLLENLRAEIEIEEF